MNMEQLNRMLDEVGKRDGMTLQLNHEGTAGVELKAGVKIFFEYVKAKESLYIYTPLMNIPSDDARRLALFEAMLGCNFLNLGCETGGLGIFRHTGQAVYQIGLKVAGLTADRLDKAIDDLLDQRDEVIHQLEQTMTEYGKPTQSHNATGSTFNRLAMTLRQR